MAKVLIVDDEQPVREFIAQVLTEDGYDTVTATDGKQALELVEQEQPDLIISDTMMPVLNGAELCRRLKHGPETLGIPIILMSSAGRQVASGSGADDFLDKPFDLLRLDALVQRWLQAR